MIFDNPVYSSSEFFITIIVLGSCIAVSYKRLTGQTPGGIVPIGATLILAVRNPLWALFCFLLSFVGYFLFILFVSKIDKRGGFPHVYAIALISMIIGLVSASILQYLGVLDIQGATIGGLIVPAILANQYRLQGIFPTVKGYSSCIAASIVFVLILVFIANSFGINQQLFASFQSNHIPSESRYLVFSPPASIISLVFGFFIYRKLRIRTGGYIMAPLAAQLMTSSNTFYIFIFGLVLLYLFQIFLTRYTLIIGLHRYLANIVASASFVWLAILFLQRSLSNMDATYLGSAWILVLILGSYSTDLYVFRRKGVFAYILLNTLIAYLVVIALRVAPSF